MKLGHEGTEQVEVEGRMWGYRSMPAEKDCRGGGLKEND